MRAAACHSSDCWVIPEWCFTDPKSRCSDPWYQEVLADEAAAAEHAAAVPQIVQERPEQEEERADAEKKPKISEIFRALIGLGITKDNVFNRINTYAQTRYAISVALLQRFAITYCRCLGKEDLTHLQRAQFCRHIIHECQALSKYAMSDGDANPNRTILDSIRSLRTIQVFNI